MLSGLFCTENSVGPMFFVYFVKYFIFFLFCSILRNILIFVVAFYCVQFWFGNYTLVTFLIAGSYILFFSYILEFCSLTTSLVFSAWSKTLSVTLYCYWFFVIAYWNLNISCAILSICCSILTSYFTPLFHLFVCLLVFI